MSRQRTREKARTESDHYDPEPLPTWYKAVMFGLMIVGLVWIIVYYLSSGLYPIAAIGGWNIMVGFGIAIAGFIMTTKWE